MIGSALVKPLLLVLVVALALALAPEAGWGSSREDTLYEFGGRHQHQPAGTGAWTPPKSFQPHAFSPPKWQRLPVVRDPSFRPLWSSQFRHMLQVPLSVSEH